MQTPQAPSFEQITSGEKSLLAWIREHLKDGKLDEFLPDEDSIAAFMPQLKGMRFVDGMLDGILGARDDKDAQKLLAIFEDFARAELNDALIDEYLGRIYVFAMKRLTLSYIDDFLELILRGDDKVFHFCITTAKHFVKGAAHREPVKLGLAMLGLTRLDEDALAMYQTFGLSDEFANYVAVALKRNGRNDLNFELAKRVKGWGRVQYLNFLDIADEQMREWVLLKGYECDISQNYTAALCMQKGDLLGFIKERGFDEALYDACLEMFDALMNGNGPHSLDEYSDYAAVFELFIKQSAKIQTNAKRFANLLDINSFISFMAEKAENSENSGVAENENIENAENSGRAQSGENLENEPNSAENAENLSGVENSAENIANLNGEPNPSKNEQNGENLAQIQSKDGEKTDKKGKEIDEDERKLREFALKYKDEVLSLVRHIAFESGEDWKKLVLSDIFNPYHRQIARKLGFDLWREFYQLALRDEKFSEWYELTRTDSIGRYKQLCELVKCRFDLEGLKSEPRDELGMHSKFRPYDELEFVVQGLRGFDEIFGVEIVQTLLQSPVTRSRNMALHTIEFWGERLGAVPESIIAIIKKNKPKEPNSDILERYEKILAKF